MEVKKDIKLYGVAVAVIPTKENPDIYRLTCTPIAMDQANKQDFEILDNLKYSQEFDSMNLASTSVAFSKMVQTIETVTQMQERSCKAANIEYRPTPLVIGQNSQQAVQIDAIYTLLLGEKNPVLAYARRNIAEETIAARKEARDAYLEESALPHTFKAACEKFTALAPKCTFRIGSYKAPTGRDDPDINTPNEIDTELKQLKPLFDQGDLQAKERIKQIASEMGTKIGEKDVYGNMFCMSIPRGYESSQELQEKLPRYAFYHWDPEFSAAFHEAFSQEHWDRGYQSIKLPLDPPKPFFTDVVADRIRNQFQIVEGKREPSKYEDHNRLLKAALEPMNKLISQNQSQALPVPPR